MTATKTQTLRRPLTFGDRVIRLVFWSRRMNRLFFPSPAETRFIQLMGGRILHLRLIRSRRTGFPLAIVLSMGYLKGELVEREVWVSGKYCVDFGTPNAIYHKAIEIDGRQYHDIVEDQERDEYLKSVGWQVKRIPAWRLKREPRQVYVEVCKFLKS